MNDLRGHLQRLQAEADRYGFHYRLRAWVGDGSSVARVLTDCALHEEDIEED